MKFVKLAAASAMMVALAGCAGSVSHPVAVSALSADQLSTVHISDVSSDAADGVNMTSGDFGLINFKVRNYIQSDSQGVIVDPSTHDALTLKMHFTRFDRGNAVARFILIGLGQIHIDADVLLMKTDGTVVGKYKVKKTFALGGVLGAVTRVEEVEDGFARSVAEVVKQKAAA